MQMCFYACCRQDFDMRRRCLVDYYTTTMKTSVCSSALLSSSFSAVRRTGEQRRLHSSSKHHTATHGNAHDLHHDVPLVGPLTIASVYEPFPMEPTRPQVHYSRYIAPQWAVGCQLVDQITNSLFYHRPHPADDKLQLPQLLVACVQLLAHRLYVPPTSVAAHAWRSALNLFRNAVTLRSQEGLLHRNGKGMLALSSSAVSSSGSPSAVASSSSSVIATDFSRVSGERMIAETLALFYTDTSAAHLMRNLSMSGDELRWQQALTLYTSMLSVWRRNNNRETGRPQPMMSSSDSLPPPPHITDPQSSGIVPGSIHQPVLFSDDRPSVFRAVRLMTMTTLLDQGKWQHAMMFLQHALQCRDLPNHVAMGHLLKRLGEHGRWVETLQVMHLAGALVKGEKVAYPSTQNGTIDAQKKDIKNTSKQNDALPTLHVQQDTSSPTSSQQTLHVVVDRRLMTEWHGAFSLGVRVLATIAEKALVEERQFSSPTNLTSSSSPKVSETLRSSSLTTLIESMREGIATSSGPRNDSGLQYALHRLKQLEQPHQKISVGSASGRSAGRWHERQSSPHRPSAQREAHLPLSISASAASTDVQTAAAVVRGACIAGDWLQALELLTETHRSLFQTSLTAATIDNQQPMASSSGISNALLLLQLRQFVLNAVPVGNGIVMFAVIDVLDRSFKQSIQTVIARSQRAPQKGESGGGELAPFHSAQSHEHEVILARLGHRHSAVPMHCGAWVRALSQHLLLPFVPHSAGAAAVGPKTTARAVSFALRVGMPWHIALHILQEYRPLLLASHAEFKQTSDVGAFEPNQEAAGTTPNHGRRSSTDNTHTSNGHNLSPYVSSLLNVSETLCRQRQTIQVGNLATPHIDAALKQLLTSIIVTCHTSPSAYLLKYFPKELRVTLLEEHGQVIDPIILYYVLTAKDTSLKVSTWHECLALVGTWARRSARMVPERSSDSVFRSMKGAPFTAVLGRLSGAVLHPTHLSSSTSSFSSSAVLWDQSDCPPPDVQQRLALQLWKWVGNAQPSCFQKANYDPVDSVTATKQLALIGLKAAAVVLSAPDALCYLNTHIEEMGKEHIAAGTTSLSSQTEVLIQKQADEGVKILYNLFLRHKLRPPLHCFSPSTLDELLPSSVFHEPYVHLPLHRISAVVVCVEAMLLLCERSQGPPVELSQRNSEREALYQCVKMTARAARYFAAVTACTTTPSTSNVVAPSASSAQLRKSQFPAFIPQCNMPITRSAEMWLLAFRAASLADTRYGLNNCRPQLLEQLLSAESGQLPAHVASHLVKRYGLDQGKQCPMAISEKLARSLISTGVWTKCLEALMIQRPRFLVSSVDPNVTLSALF